MPSPHHVPFPVSPVAGQKRPAPSLLPAFEPFSSSPALPRPAKHLTHASPAKHHKQLYPTPVPTSSTLIASSSPQLPPTRRPGLHRTASAFSERAPLATVPSIELSESGEPTFMGRSSNSSHYQLSTHKQISRVHVRAVYVAANDTAPPKLLIECTGWNGLKVHCQGKAWDLKKGDTFASETEDVDIMVDVQDARVLVTWPRHEPKVLTPTDSDSTWNDENSPTRRIGVNARNRPPYISPLRHEHRLQSPVSPSPVVQATHATATATGFMASDPPVPVPVQVYEDEPSDEDKKRASQPTQSTHIASQTLASGLEDSQSGTSGPLSSFSDKDEENDPIITSFGPYGANLGARLESFTTTTSPEVRRPLQEVKEESISPQRAPHAGSSSKRRRVTKHRDASSSRPEDEGINEITRHVISQLIYTPLSAMHLSILYQNLPSPLKATLTQISLKSLLDDISCIGSVERPGKDAAGKRLESEYYYDPERDADEERREMVEGLGGRGLRSCRKSFKQYYWRKPKKP